VRSVAGLVAIAGLCLLNGCRSDRGSDDAPALKRLASFDPGPLGLTLKSAKPFDTLSLFEIIDGGAPVYVDGGMKQGVLLSLKDASGRGVDAFLMRFGDGASCRRIFGKMRADIDTVVGIAGFADSAAVGRALGPAALVYFHTGAIFVELHVEGYAKASEGLGLAANMLARFSALIGGN